MRIKSLFLAAVLAAFSAPALAATQWDPQLTAAPQGPVRVGEVRLGEELAAHVQDIGERDLDRLLEELRAYVERALAERGVLAGPEEAGATALDLVLLEAQPNRPTFDQLGGRGDWNWDRDRAGPGPGVSLSLSSFGIGRVKVEGAFTAPDGAPLGTVTYRYEETDISEAQYAATWTDVHRGFNMFAQRVAGLVAE